MLQELNKAWLYLKQLAKMRQDKLFGAHEIQRFNRDADETVTWITEKDGVLSSDDYGRDLATVQTLQVTHFSRCYSPRRRFRRMYTRCNLKYSDVHSRFFESSLY